MGGAVVVEATLVLVSVMILIPFSVADRAISMLLESMAEVEVVARVGAMAVDQATLVARPLPCSWPSPRSASWPPTLCWDQGGMAAKAA